MKKFSLILSLIVWLAPVLGLAQLNQTILPFKASGYRYQAVKAGATVEKDFWKLTYSEDSKWSTGSAAAGTVNNTTSPPCPLNLASNIGIDLPSSRNVLLRKYVTIPAGARNVRVSVSIDNSVQVWFNGTNISGGVKNHISCASDSDFVFQVTQGVLAQGSYLLAVQGIWQNSKSYLDVRVVADLGYTITTDTVGTGTVTPPSPSYVFSGGSYTALYKAGTGYHVASVAVDNQVKILSQSSYLPAETTLTINPVTKNYSIKATFGLNYYPVTTAPDSTSPTATGRVRLTRTSVPHGESFTATVVANTGYHITGVKFNGIADPDFPSTVGQPTSLPTSWSKTYSNITAPAKVEATFDVNYYSLTIPSGGSVVLVSSSTPPFAGTSNPPYYVHGTTVTLRAWAPSGSYVKDWTINGVDTSAGINPLTVTMDANKSVTPNFATLPDPATYFVGNNNDSGTGSLRAAIDSAESHPGLDYIEFNSTFNKNAPILISSPLPANDQLILNATTAGGLVTIEPAADFGAGTGSDPDGLTLSGVVVKWGYVPEGTIVRGLQVQKFPGAGICIGSDNSTVEGCVIRWNTGDGICIEGVNGTTIGGKEEGKKNYIYENGGAGVSISRQTGVLDNPPHGNAILGNAIYGNTGLGIDIVAVRTDGGGWQEVRGITWNRFPADNAQWATYINNGQSFPDLYFASTVRDEPNTPQTSYVLGKLHGPAGKTFRIEIFLNDAGDPSGNGEGKTLVGTSDDAPATISEDAGAPGFYTFEIPLRVKLRGGEVLSATATDDANNTSEFSTTLYAGVITRRFGEMEAKQDPTIGENTRWVVNTTFAGKPIHWADGKGLYTIGQSFNNTQDPNNGNLNDFKSEIAAAFADWNLAASLVLQYSVDPDGHTTDKWGGEPDGINAITYAGASEWQSKTYGLASDNTIAITRVRFSTFDGSITDADIIFNGDWFRLRRGDPNPGSNPPANEVSFRVVIDHEVGHWGGTADYYNPGDPFYSLFMGPRPATGDVTMYGLIKNTDYRSGARIFADDISAINFIYGLAESGHADMALLFDGSTFFSSATSVNGFTPSQNAAIQLIDKMRPGDRIGAWLLPSNAAEQPTQILPFTEILGDIGDQGSNRGALQDAIAAMVPATSDVRALGSSLQYVASQVSGLTDAGRRGIILFSAGNENASPSALNETVLGSVAGIPVFTMGFAESQEGQDLGSALATATSGRYYFAADSTISETVNQIWFNQVGQQLMGDKTLPSQNSDPALAWQGPSAGSAIAWQGPANGSAIAWQGPASGSALAWQGTTDKGSTAILPALAWQGAPPPSGAGKVTASGPMPKFHLALIPPGVSVLGWTGPGDPPGTITPTNWTTYPGVQYVTGPTYAFYVISSDFTGRKDGEWGFVPYGANDVSEPDYVPIPAAPIPIVASLAATTDVVMDVTLDKSTYSVRDLVYVRVSLTEGGVVQALHTLGGGPISGANVVSVFTNPSTGVRDTIQLTESGSGIYLGTFTNTQVSGSYDLHVSASGVAPSLNSPFVRLWEEAFYVLPPYRNAVLFAERTVTLGLSSRITAGDVVVNRDAQPTDPGVELHVSTGASTPAGFSLKADRIQVDSGATVASDVYFNQLILFPGIVTGKQTTPLAVPVGDFPPFETVDPAVMTATPVSIANGGSLPLTGPLVRGDVTLEPRATLTLGPGRYDFKSIRMKTGSRIHFTGPAVVHVRYGIHADNTSYFGPAPVSGSAAPVDPSEIMVFAQGTNSESSSSLTVNFSPKSIVQGTIYAPNGTILLNQETQATGAYLAKDITIGQLVQLTLSSAFGNLARVSAGEEETQGQPEAQADVPTTYVLSQNYPNPFNPSTQIRYGLPRQSHVTLTIYNVIGQEVARLLDEVQTEGYHEVRWNGLNASGTPVGTGIYFYQLRAGEFAQVRKMVLVK